jgi:putative transcriptional regulator
MNRSERPVVSCPAFFLLTATLLITLLAMTAGPVLPGDTGLLAAKIPVEPVSPFLSEPDANLSKGKFLVASREMTDPRFREAVILLVDHSDQGAMGLVINRPSDARLSMAFPDVEGLKKRGDLLYMGGPVRPEQMFMLVRSSGRPDDSSRVLRDVYVSVSRSLLLKLINKGETAKRVHVFAGYTGWSPGQLEREVALGGWQVMSADAETVFEKEPLKIWPELIRRSSLKWIRRRDGQDSQRSGSSPL